MVKKRLPQKLAVVSTVFAACLTSSMMTANSASAIVNPNTLDSQTEVNNWYKTQYLPAMNTNIGFTGNVSKCNRGTFSNDALYRQQQQFNAVRDLVGLERVKLYKGDWEQQAALMMDASWRLSHYPDKSFKCWTKVGANAASWSNLAVIPNYMSKAGSALDLYLKDPGGGNIDAGHRRWLLDPSTTAMWVGQTPQGNAMKVVFVPQNTKNARAPYVAWPRNGYSPVQIEPLGRWSLTINNARTTFYKPTVTVYKNGKKMPTPRVYTPKLGYGMPTIVWDMPADTNRVGEYKVTVTGIRASNGKLSSYTYYPKIFQAK